MRLALPASAALLTAAVTPGPHRQHDVAREPSFTLAAADTFLPDGALGCRITVTGKNTGIRILIVEATSQVRSKPSGIVPQYGPWKKMWEKNHNILPGKSWSAVYDADFGCGHLRQYRFVLTYSSYIGGPAPSQKSFTTPTNGGTKEPTIALGDLYTGHFAGF